MKQLIPFICTFYFASAAYTQHYTRTDTIPVYQNGDTLKFPWAGGHNSVQLSDIDLNFDGIKDLFVFDRSGNKITTYLNGGIPNAVDYIHAFQYQDKFPLLQYWALLIDYNCDGKEDIFTSSVFPSSIQVYKNTSTPPNLQFTLVDSFLQAGTTYIPANNIGLPAIEDIDNDGDLDILTFTTGNAMMDYFINQSQEQGYGCDSLIFLKDPACWGHFAESGALCTVATNACKTGGPNDKAEDDTFIEARETQHNGSSCSLCLDMDGDGDQELVIGQGNCCNLTLLTNGGDSANANMASFTNNFPDSVVPVIIKYNPCGFFLDVNNDNKRDFIASSSMVYVSINTESIWYYKNNGLDNTPIFSRQTRSFLQEDMIDVGSDADPVFFDFDNDGLTDLLVSNYVVAKDSCPSSYSYGVYAYKNTGTPSSPKFNLVNTDFANLSTKLPNLTNKHLTFGDADGDGAADMFVGDYDGHIHYLKNTGGAGPANFPTAVMNYTDALGFAIDIGSHATPQLIDIDRDNDLDLIIGERAGNLNYYQNIGSSAVPSYSLVTSSFGNVDVQVPCCSGFSEPFIYDSAGSYRMLVGSEASRTPPFNNGIWFYKNIDGNLAGTFTMMDSAMQNIWEGIRMMVNGKDITNDGKMDLVIGNSCGGVAIYLGDTLTTGINELTNEAFDFSIYPNPSNGKFQISNLIPKTFGTQISSLEIYTIMGDKVYSEKIPDKKSFSIELDQPKGIYFCKVYGKNISATKKIVLLK